MSGFFMGVFLLLLSGCNRCYSPGHPPEARALVIPDDVQHYIDQMEAKVNDLKPDTHKKIFWAGEINTPSEYALVSIHGLAGSRLVQESALRELAGKLNANFFATRVAGHGQPAQYMSTVTAYDWVDSVYEAIAIGRKIGRKVVVACHSTSCPALAVVLAQEFSHDLYAAIFLSPNFGARNRLSELLLYPGGLSLIRKLYGNTVSLERKKLTPYQQMLKQRFIKNIDAAATLTFPIEALKPVMQVVRWGRCADHSSAQMPLLFVYSPDDKTVNVSSIRKYRDRYINATTSTLLVERNSIDLNSHLLIGQFTEPSQSKDIVSAIHKFIRQPHQQFIEHISLRK